MIVRNDATGTGKGVFSMPFDPSLLTYLGLLAVLAAVRIAMVLAGYPDEFQTAGAEYTLAGFAVIAVLGFLGLLLSRRTGFPDLWSAAISNRQRFLWPALYGVGFGLFLIVINLFQPADSVMRQIHIDLAEAALVYTYGAIFLETVFRLFLMSILLWALCAVLGHQHQAGIFWTLAVLLSLVQPVLMAVGLVQMSGAGASVAALAVPLASALVVGFGFDLLAFALWRRSGFLAPLTMRLSTYGVWHMLWGGVLFGLIS